MAAGARADEGRLRIVQLRNDFRLDSQQFQLQVPTASGPAATPFRTVDGALKSNRDKASKDHNLASKNREMRHRGLLKAKAAKAKEGREKHRQEDLQRHRQRLKTERISASLAPQKAKLGKVANNGMHTDRRRSPGKLHLTERSMEHNDKVDHNLSNAIKANLMKKKGIGVLNMSRLPLRRTKSPSHRHERLNQDSARLPHNKELAGETSDGKIINIRVVAQLEDEPQVRIKNSSRGRSASIGGEGQRSKSNPSAAGAERPQQRYRVRLGSRPVPARNKISCQSKRSTSAGHRYRSRESGASQRLAATVGPTGIDEEELDDQSSYGAKYRPDPRFSSAPGTRRPATPAQERRKDDVWRAL